MPPDDLHDSLQLAPPAVRARSACWPNGKHIELTDGQLQDYLDYCSHEEIRISAFRMEGLEATATMRWRSPTYTKEPVQYLSSSDLLVGAAQLGNAMAAVQVEHELGVLRNSVSRRELHSSLHEHNAFFTEFNIRFRHQVTMNPVPLQMRFEWIRRFRGMVCASAVLSCTAGCSGQGRAVWVLG